MVGSPYIREARVILGLMLPVLVAQGAQMALGVVDVVMTGHYAARDMAAAGLGWALWLPVFLFGIGLILAVLPAVGQLRGAGGQGTDEMRGVIRQGVWLAVLLSVPVMALVAWGSFHLGLFGIPTELAGIVGPYLRALTVGILPCFLYVVLHNMLEGFSLVRPAMIASLAGLLVNVPANYGFVFGRFGLPELGGAGAGMALSVTNWVLFAIILAFALRHPDIGAALRTLGRPRLAPLRKLAGIGFPNALASLNEGGLFSVVTMFAAPLGTMVVAGHNVAMNVSSIVFLLPLSIGIAATIRVSHAIGALDARRARTTTRVALGMALLGALATAVLTVALRYEIVGLYNSDVQVIAVAAVLLLIDAAYQLMDAFQVVSVGILRAYNDTRSIFAVTFVCFWVAAIPLAYVLGRTDILCPAMGVCGLWWGLVVGLTSAAVGYAFRLRTLENRFRRKCHEV